MIHYWENLSTIKLEGQMSWVSWSNIISPRISPYECRSVSSAVALNQLHDSQVHDLTAIAADSVINGRIPELISMPLYLR